MISGILTGYRCLKKHFHNLGLEESTLYRGCGMNEETSVTVMTFRDTSRHPLKRIESFFEGFGFVDA